MRRDEEMLPKMMCRKTSKSKEKALSKASKQAIKAYLRDKEKYESIGVKPTAAYLRKGFDVFL